MKNRVPLYPGRVTLTPVTGQPNTYDLVRADQPSEVGTPLNKASLLKDETSDLFFGSGDHVPDEALAFLGQYSQHWWRRRRQGEVGNVTLGTASATKIYVYNSQASSRTYTIYYSSTAGVSNNSVILTGDIQSFQATGQVDVSVFSVVKGKYWYYVDFNNSASSVYYTMPFASNATTSTYMYETTYSIVSALCSGMSSFVTGEWDYLSSTSADTYSPGFMGDNYLYEYLGRPLANTQKHVMLSAGSYMGTGTFGSENPNTLTLPFVPHLLFLYKQGKYLAQDKFGTFSNGAQYGAAIGLCAVLGTNYAQGLFYGDSLTSNGYTYAKLSNDGKTIYWYNTESASNQFNDAIKYIYTALG